MPPAAVTSTSSIIFILTLVHPFATSWPSSPKGDARTLGDWLSVSYVTQYPVPPIFSFPLEGKSREAGKGVRGRAPIGCSIAVLTANRRPPERSGAQNVVSRFPFRGAQIIKTLPPSPSFRPKRSGVEKSPSSDGTSVITVGDLSTQSIIKAFSICPIPTCISARDDGVGEQHTVM